MLAGKPWALSARVASCLLSIECEHDFSTHGL
jgi:hypothetical protein